MTNDGERLETTVYFKPRPLENLLLVDELASMSPLTDAKVGYWLTETEPKFWDDFIESFIHQNCIDSIRFSISQTKTPRSMHFVVEDLDPR